MLKKNIDKEKRKDRPTWVGYYQRIVQPKTIYKRKPKHKKGNTDE